MEPGDSEHVEVQSHEGITIKKEVEDAARPAEYIEIEVNVNCIKEEPGLAGLVKSEPGVSVQGKVAGDGWQAVTDSQHSNEETQPVRRAQPRLYSCDKCQQVYSSRDNLRNHRRQVHGIESHKCNECNTEYKSKTYLLKHVRHVHSKQQYECAVCRKMCKSKEALSKHVTSLHRRRSAGSESHTYSCDYCQKTFTIKTRMRNHITWVHASGSYKCGQCSKSFKCEQYLKTHTAYVHTARRQVCNVCGKSLSSSHLRRHMLNKHSDKQLQCKLCGEIMKSKQFLHQHLMDLHGQKSAEKQRTVLNDGIKNFQSKRSSHQNEECGSCSHHTALSTSAGHSTDAAASSTSQWHDVVVVKAEPADGQLEVLQHMDCNYRPYKEEPQHE